LKKKNMASNLVNPIHPVLVAFVEDIANNFKAFKMNEICRHLKLQATLEDFSGFHALFMPRNHFAVKR